MSQILIFFDFFHFLVIFGQFKFFKIFSSKNDFLWVKKSFFDLEIS